MALRPLSQVDDYTFPEGAFDVRGWEVRTDADDEKVGRVDDVLLDANGDLRYLDVDLGLFRKHVLVPLSRAHVEGGRDVVWVEGVAKDSLEAIPEYDRDPELVTDEYGRRLDLAWDDARRPVTAERAVPVGLATDSTTDELPLARLADLDDYKVAGDTDPRGWKVITADAERIGEVSELLIDQSRMRAAYLDCDLDEKRLDLEPLDRHVLIPLQRVRLDRRHKRVVVDGLLARDLARYPVYGGLPLRRPEAAEVDRLYGRETEREREVERVEAGRERAAAAASHGHFFGDPATRGELAARPRAADAVDTRRVDIGRDDTTTIRRDDDEVRIRVRGDDIIIEKRRAD